MLYHKTPLAGLYLIEMEPNRDDRGWFSRCLDVSELAAQGLDAGFKQANFSFSCKRGTLRGLHLQLPPATEDKLLKVTRGRLLDVAVDLRQESETYCQWFGVELAADDFRLFYIPKGFAHGYVTLEDDTEVFYAMTASYAPDLARGVRWDDPAFGIQWPITEGLTMADRDRHYPDFRPELGLKGLE